MRAFRTWALLISLAGHLGLVAWLLHKPPEQGAVSAGLGGIEVAMAPSGGAPGATVPTAPLVAAAAVPVETATPVDQAQPVEAVEPPPPPVAAVETELPPVIGSTAGEEVAAVEPERAETRTTGPATEAGTVKAEVAEIPAPEGQAVATEPDQVRPIDGPGAARGVEPEVVQTQEMRPAPTPAAKPVIRPRPREVAQRPPPLPQPAHGPAGAHAFRAGRGPGCCAGTHHGTAGRVGTGREYPNRPMPAATMARPAAERRAHRRTM